ncbi:NAD dependent epimerase/dehydratase family protein [Aspergillus ellipticus CBS 707.79]|uniref:NAD dependent epimerase/dehydratase family protein n=1 Tax=Aspergillus ellipticus CBS 707.79 TaxID=1448320 RepID=A0A319D393_9EURO|nr:NAD dependent epimerase/dehydratase family protein [Aspergillus ellipticus CBS 707.79]
MSTPTSTHNILLTGASGYLGGTLLARYSAADLPAHQKLFALVRSDAQAQAVKKYGAEPLLFNLNDEDAITQVIITHEISIILFLIDAGSARYQPVMIRALAQVKRTTNRDVHFLHTTGAKAFSGHAGHPTDVPLSDADPGLFELLGRPGKANSWLGRASGVNRTVIETAEAHGVNSYIFIPCIVYGPGEGFGNRISIQTQAIVKAAVGMRRVFRVDEGRPSWPVSHVRDTVGLYLELLRKMLRGEELGSGRQGYYLASSGSVVWEDLYEAMGARLAERGVVDDATVWDAKDADLERIGEIIGRPADFVPLEIGGKCTLEAHHGRQIGWVLQYGPEHILAAAADEVDLILENL